MGGGGGPPPPPPSYTYVQEAKRDRRADCCLDRLLLLGVRERGMRLACDEHCSRESRRPRECVVRCLDIIVWLYLRCEIHRILDARRPGVTLVFGSLAPKQCNPKKKSPSERKQVYTYQWSRRRSNRSHLNPSTNASSAYVVFVCLHTYACMQLPTTPFVVHNTYVMYSQDEVALRLPACPQHAL